MSPLKIPQYMAYGKAIVASDIPAHRELLRNNETAILVPCYDTLKWKEAINRLINDKMACSKLGRAAYHEYRREFTPEVRVQKILNGVLDS